MGLAVPNGALLQAKREKRAKPPIQKRRKSDNIINLMKKNAIGKIVLGSGGRKYLRSRG
jgi:hypothetical protein